jgi:hypothetical protein
MAHNVTSSVVSNQNASPITKVQPSVAGGKVRSAFGYLTIVATTAAQTNCFVRVPVTARLKDVRLSMATMGNGSVKIGFFRPNGGIAVDDDAITAAAALTAQTRASVFDGPSNANREKTIADWLATEIGTAGATYDTHLDIVASVVTVSTGTAVAVGLDAEYVVDA